jgi:hypothetical protein
MDQLVENQEQQDDDDGEDDLRQPEGKAFQRVSPEDENQPEKKPAPKNQQRYREQVHDQDTGRFLGNFPI